MAQISEMARSIWQQMSQSGVTDQSFDLRLDLRQLGMSIDANGRRSMEGRSLSVNLHVEAHQGTLKTDQGEASFKSLDVSFELQQTETQVSEGQKPKPGGLVDGLKKLIDLLEKAGGQPDQAQGLGDLLRQIGEALQEMAKRVKDGSAAIPQGPPNDQPPAVRYEETVHVSALRVEMLAVQDAQRQAA